jgi:outer membrane protein OmpA-like peptidoglycan-associated protein
LHENHKNKFIYSISLNESIMQKIFSKTAITFSVSLMLSGCATAPNSGNGLKDTFASDDPCSNNSRNIGVLIGVAAGAMIAKTIGASNEESLIMGGAAGAVVGGLIGADMDRRRCELSKIAKTYDLDVTFKDINIAPAANGQAANSQPASTSAVSVLAIRDKESGKTPGHFETGSDQLTAKAQQYFSAIAQQYANITLESEKDPKIREIALKQYSLNRRLLLVGHTDDSGSSRLNAELSERRARTVAQYLTNKGVPKSNIYFQGAGEAYPVADNRTEDGRALNRRVEIVEAADEKGFNGYLEARKPNLALYRASTPKSAPITQDKPNAAIKTSDSAGPKQALSKPTTDNATVKTNPEAQAAPIRTTGTSNSTDKSLADLDLGGAAASVSNWKKMDIGQQSSNIASFNFITTAHAADDVRSVSCAQDRPRHSGEVKNLATGKKYSIREYMAGAARASWGAKVNGHFVGLTSVSVLRDGSIPADKPNLLIFKNWTNASNPDATIPANVNAYIGDKAVLYRAFPERGPIKCIDMLIDRASPSKGFGSNIVYTKNGAGYQADYNPIITRN